LDLICGSGGKDRLAIENPRTLISISLQGNPLYLLSS
jgi:hypothetical protein